MTDNPYETEEQCWQAVQRRDAAADGLFVYGVMTTGVYCRPSCASRGTKRENVRFYTLHAEAEQDGLRPCKRCRPTKMSVAQRHTEAVEKACRFIESSEERVSLATLADVVGMKPHYFHKVFKRITGITPKSYEKAHRGDRVRKALHSAGSVTDAIYASGAGSSSSFQTTVDRAVAMKPDTFRKGGAGETIFYGVGQSWLGLVMVGVTSRGICAIRLGDDDKALLAELQAAFPRANLVPGDSDYQSILSKTVAFIEKQQGAFDLPLDIQGTVFQQRVWQQLQKIPTGETRTYADVAEAIGKPKAVRAVASACAANSLAVVVPCHRVVRSDGGISGYRWGPERKKRLLAREAKS